MLKKVCVYCGSSMGISPEYKNVASELGKLMYESGIELVYGGAKCGIMGVIADEILTLGGRVCGIVPSFFNEYEVIHTEISELIYVSTMQERKEKMIEMSDAFIVLPGAYGTLDEMFETLCLMQLKQINKPLVLLNLNGYYDFLLRQLDKMKDEGFLTFSNLELLEVVDKVKDLLPSLSKKM